MINCAHPTHFEHVLDPEAPWAARVRGVRRMRRRRAMQSWTKPRTLDDGDPDDLARRDDSLRPGLPAMSVVGGCCGTDHRHVAAICRTLLA